MIASFIKRHKWIQKPLLYLYHKHKNRHLVKFWYSTHLSPRCEFEGMNMVHPHSSFYGRMGFGSYIGANVSLNADIGRFTSIAPDVKCINGSHPMREPFVTTCPLFYSVDNKKNPLHVTFAKEQMYNEFRQYDASRGIDVKVGNDCWIGTNATLLGGIKIHDGAVVLANAWVVKDVPPYAIVGGTPAKIIDYRYDAETISLLLDTKWWEKEIEWLKSNWKLMCNMSKFKEAIEHEQNMANDI